MKPASAGSAPRDGSIIQKNGLPRKIGFSRSQTNLSQAGLFVSEVEIETIKHSVRNSEAPAARYSDLFFRHPKLDFSAPYQAYVPTTQPMPLDNVLRVASQSNRTVHASTNQYDKFYVSPLSYSGLPSDRLKYVARDFSFPPVKNAGERLSISSEENFSGSSGLQSGLARAATSRLPPNYSSINPLPIETQTRYHLSSPPRYMEQERRIEQSNSDVSLTSIVSTELSTGYLETSMRRSRPIEAASAIQAALPPIEFQNVRSKLVSKPVLQHASAPEPAKPRKLAQVNRNDLQPLDRRDGFQYDPVGPLATGRCERVVSRDWQFKGFHGQVKELGCSTDRANQNTALSTPSIADHNLSPVDPLAIGRRQPISSSSGNLIGSSDLSSDERCIRGSPVTVMSSPFGDQASFDENYSPKFRIYTPVAYKFYMEQRMDNIKKYYDERRKRSQELEKDLQRANLDDETQDMVRQILNQKESNYLRQKRAKMGARDFEKICTVGVGAFGEVVLARKKETGQYYAIKILIKSDVMERNQFAHVKAERDILAEAENEWVVKLFYSFQDSRNLYFVMEYVPGGDLMKVLQNKGQFDEPLARFYTAELVCAIGSVHALGFIHRDIKPDNILIDRKGHVKLTDFGLCTGFRWTHKSQNYNFEKSREGSDEIHVRSDSLAFENREKVSMVKKESGRKLRGAMFNRSKKNIQQQRQYAHSQVGTPNYMAPEVIMSNNEAGYTQVCDWWSLGVILYEMLCGRPPFFASSPEETQRKILDWRSHLHLSSYPLSPQAADLIMRLCCEAENRLGNGKSEFSPPHDGRPLTVLGADEIKHHPFFHSVNWSQNLHQQPAPYIPVTRSDDDTSNFDEFSETNSLFPMEDQGTQTASPQGVLSKNILDQKSHQFFEFTFRRFFDPDDNSVVLRMPVRSSAGSYALPGASGAPVCHRQSQYLLEEADSWISPANLSLNCPAKKEHRLHDPPPYSVALGSNESSYSSPVRNDSHQQSHDNMPVYV